MYSILIVDDEKKEREGIKKLIKRYEYPLEVELAQNGEEALNLIKEKSFDILLTDIKMPYMNGIQLIDEVRRLGLNPICIIYSAYGEFEYAQEAISLGVKEYLLKPIELGAFQRLFVDTLALCEERENRKKEEAEIKAVVSEHINYKQQKELLSFLEGELALSELQYNSEEEFAKRKGIPILISTYSNLFSANWDVYRKEIVSIFGMESLLISKDDNQILAILFLDGKGMSAEELSGRCKEIMKISKESYQTDVFMILGNLTKSLEQLKKEYGVISEKLDYQFFMSESTLFMQDKVFFIKREQEMLPFYFERVNNSAQIGDFAGVKKEFEKIINHIEEERGYSSIYIKYTFTEALKTVCESVGAKMGFVDYLERIYEAKSFEDLGEIVFAFLDKLSSEYSDSVKENRLVRMAKEIVNERYSDFNLGVTSIASELQVTAAYLSSLFKVETGQNLVKYITQIRIDRSKKLLEQTNMKVSDVAASVGYANTSYFISIFRNQEGASPSQYREERL